MLVVILYKVRGIVVDFKDNFYCVLIFEGILNKGIWKIIDCGKLFCRFFWRCYGIVDIWIL